MLAHRVQPVLPHKKIHSFTTYIIALTARGPSLWTLVLWVPPICLQAVIGRSRGRGHPLFFRTMMFSADSVGGLLFQSSVFHRSSSVLDLRYSGPPGF
jgi:hypothetical protein